jgi:hypothetical protein
MPSLRTQPPDEPQTDRVERVVAINVLGRSRGRSREWLYQEISFTRAEIDGAIERLQQAGVVIATPGTVRASQALRLLDALHLIGV